MPSADEIRSALHASRVIPLNVPSIHGPLGLEHLASIVATLPKGSGDTLTIPVQPETRKALERLATIQSQKTRSPTSPAQVAAAILEEVISTGKF